MSIGLKQPQGKSFTAYHCFSPVTYTALSSLIITYHKSL